MIAINFKAKFADLVATGKKTQTIRRTNRFKVGDTLQLYTGQRTKACRKLGEAVVTDVIGVGIYNDGVVFPICDGFFFASNKGTSNFAKKDGFKDFEEMKAFFVAQYGDLPFEGYLIQWKLKGSEG
jgi:hypothetical protein